MSNKVYPGVTEVKTTMFQIALKGFEGSDVYLYPQTAEVALQKARRLFNEELAAEGADDDERLYADQNLLPDAHYMLSWLFEREGIPHYFEPFDGYVDSIGCDFDEDED